MMATKYVRFLFCTYVLQRANPDCNPGYVTHLRRWVEPGLRSGLGSEERV